MTVLITGASGTTGSRLATQLSAHGIPNRRAGRTRAADVRFDWTDPATFAPAVRDVRAVYLVPPIGVLDPQPLVLPFLAAAQRAGVARIVLLSSSAVPVGGPGLGRLGARLPEYVPEWVILRPTWFASNFTGEHPHGRSARDTGQIVSATADGRVPFIDPADIAAVARHALTDARLPGRGLVLTGPQPLSFDEVAAALSDHLGRTVRHRRVSTGQLSRHLRSNGLPAEFADLLAGMDAAIAAGSEDRTTTTVYDVTGTLPRGFPEFLTAQDRIRRLPGEGAADRSPGPAAEISPASNAGDLPKPRNPRAAILPVGCPGGGVGEDTGADLDRRGVQR